MYDGTILDAKYSIGYLNIIHISSWKKFYIETIFVCIIWNITHYIMCH